MSSMHMIIRKFVQSCVSYSLVKMASLFKVSCIIGSQAALFSATSVVIPLVGAFTGPVGALMSFGLGYSLRMVLTGGFALSYLAYHIPGLCAALYWTSESVLIRLVLPLVCMIAFISHPVGGQAYLYSCYWLIPVVLYAIPRKTLFSQAIGSTFIAHAVGSVIWIYTVPMTAAQWWALIPVVIVERLLFAAGMVAVYVSITTAARTTFGARVALYFARYKPMINQQ